MLGNQQSRVGVGEKDEGIDAVSPEHLQHGLVTGEHEFFIHLGRDQWTAVVANRFAEDRCVDAHLREHSLRQTGAELAADLHQSVHVAGISGERAHDVGEATPAHDTRRQKETLVHLKHAHRVSIP